MKFRILQGAYPGKPALLVSPSLCYSIGSVCGKLRHFGGNVKKETFRVLTPSYLHILYDCNVAIVLCTIFLGSA